MTWLVTGGAGYIGSHLVHALVESGSDVVVLDDLSTGYSHRVPEGVPLIRTTVLDTVAVTDALRVHGVTGVIHLAGKKNVGESFLRPDYYHEQNVVGLERLLEAMDLVGVGRLVFSSSCSVYGDLNSGVIDETAATRPVSPYGNTKLRGEELVRSAGVSRGLSWIALRYFNVAGATDPSLGESATANLVPMVFNAICRNQVPRIFGADYPTADGTCVRDYIHVADVVAAHLGAAEHLERTPATETYNIGRGSGVSVREIMTLIAEITGQAFEPEVVDRRPGDPASAVACTESIEAAWGWVARHDVRDMISSAWNSWQVLHRHFAPALH